MHADILTSEETLREEDIFGSPPELAESGGRVEVLFSRSIVPSEVIGTSVVINRDIKYKGVGGDLVFSVLFPLF